MADKTRQKTTKASGKAKAGEKPGTRQIVTKASGKAKAGEKPGTRQTATKASGTATAGEKLPAAEQQNDIYLLKRLAQRMGAADEAAVMRLIGKQDRNALAAEGAKVTTDRITTDCARCYGQALDFWTKAKPEQKANLPALTDGLLKLVIWSAYHGQELAEQQAKGASASATAQDARRGEAEALRKRCRAIRDQLYSMLEMAVAGDPKLENALKNTYGTMSDDEKLAEAVAAQAAFGRRLLASKDPELVERISLTQLGEAVLARAEAMAETMKSAAEEAKTPRSAPQVSHATVDVWDGINLMLFKRMVKIFDGGNAADPTIPRLIPISLRRFFNRSSPSKRAEEPADTSKPPKSTGKPRKRAKQPEDTSGEE